MQRKALLAIGRALVWVEHECRTLRLRLEGLDAIEPQRPPMLRAIGGLDAKVIRNAALAVVNSSQPLRVHWVAVDKARLYTLSGALGTREPFTAGDDPA